MTDKRNETIKEEWGGGSGAAEGAGGGGEGAHGRGQAVVGGVCEGEEEEQEEDDAHQVGREDADGVGVLHHRADGREAHVVTEGVAEHRTNQVA